MNLSELSSGDRIEIDCCGIEDHSFTVEDVEIANLGITRVIAIGLTAGCTTYALKGTHESDIAELSLVNEKQNDHDPWEIMVSDITVVEESS